MITLYVCLLLLLVHAALPGSDLRRLGGIRLRHTWLVWTALASQVLIISVLPDAGWRSDAAHLLTYALAAVFAVVNVRSTGTAVVGTAVVGAGGGLNLTAIVVNRGVMPASPDALAASGWQAPEGQFANSAVVSDARLAFLGDVFAAPAWLPVDSVYSVGDLVVVVGIAVFLHQTCQARQPRHRAPSRPLYSCSRSTGPSGPTSPGPSSVASRRRLTGGPHRAT